MENNLLQKQEALYRNLNFAVAIKKDKVGLITHFIASEKEARENDFQGQFYPSYHYEIDKVMNTKMLKILDEDIFSAFYYRLKLGIIDKPSEKHFSLFLKAVAHNIADNDLENTFLSGTKMYLLFGIKNNENSDAVYDVIYEDYIAILKFLNLCSTYTAYPNLRKKKDRFLPFLDNAILITRIKEGISFYFESNFVTAGSLVLLLLATDKTSKDKLRNLNDSALKNDDVWLLGSFYKDFQQTEANKELLNNLYSKFSKEWIDEYQKRNWD
ncbi:hypothetical protein Celal_3174 [Cellulophaga algicola DSM 14237]|uniref:Uncharacterized protein n=1 Tax=Cellulophaga algicola (strain DSM 14237 / IC166 / ACAM 630) TaxID=688270 RepID=E6X4V6_CELAD|nr:hypothetical protein [Cellulophaga algicola]ADV50448.1 hypothetical protein Celal_3174 [Cellulophaga algicola DSM 14237]